ncbi:MAG: radical SAM protein [Candidatus Rokubacteria bacterium]|nr:radical SAM protein [Candidatus Rokubacteria bacterium]
MTHVGDLVDVSARRNIPLTALVEVTYRCNLACVHCYLHEGPADRPRPPRGELTLEEIQRILGELAEAGTLFVTFTGGEVFLRRDFLDMVAHARELGLCVFVFTAGTLMTERDAERLAALAPFAVEMSVYSRDPAVHDAVTKIPGSHGRTLRALRMLKARGVQTVIKTPLMSVNAGEYAGLVALAAELGAEYGFDPMLTPRRDGDLAPLAFRLSAEALAEVARDPVVGDALRVGGALNADACGDEGICASGRRTCRISPYGEVFGCGVSRTPVGNLREQRFRDVWERAPHLGRLRALTIKDLRAARPDDPLSGGYRCSALAEIEDGDFLGPFRRGDEIAEAIRRARR